MRNHPQPSRNRDETDVQPSATILEPT